MKVLSRDSMRKADRKTIEEYGLPGSVLMETAGMRIAEFVTSLLPENTRVVILAGHGNNGGDGLVAARLLEKAGYKVFLWCSAKPGGCKAEAAGQEKYLKKVGYPINYLTDKSGLEVLVEDVQNADLVIDALLGIGVDREITGLTADLIKIVNDSNVPVLAVDIPSGIDADSGQILGIAVKADWTITFAAPKLGMFLYPGAGLTGKVIVGDIHIPDNLLKEETVELVTPAFVRKVLPDRPPDAHKGSVGKSLIVAGSPGMAGAAVMTAESALSCGSGLVYLAVPESICHEVGTKTMEVIIVPLPEQQKGIISPEAVNTIIGKSKECDALAVGPGLDTGNVTSELISKLVQLSPVPLVLDAGALAALGKKMNNLRSARHTPVITPHPGEMSRLTGIPAGQIQSSRLDVAIKNARLWECIIILKGSNTVIATPGGKVSINPTGSQALATAGTGDLLTGMVTSFIAQGMAYSDASRAAVFMHGLAGDLVPEGRGHMARDVLARYKEAFQYLVDCDSNFEGNPYLKMVRPL
ncbi:MAG: NAD(P)H-hydrate dehydratase [Bacillota bacterium]